MKPTRNEVRFRHRQYRPAAAANTTMDEQREEHLGESDRSATQRSAVSAVGRVLGWLQPRWDQTLVNLRVWIPVLENSAWKERQVKYRSRENRSGMRWTVALPRQCWECGATEGIQNRTFKETVRSFDQPLGVLTLTFGLAVLLVLLAIVAGWWWPLYVGFILTILGAALFTLKSWTERVVVSIWTCGDHDAELESPWMVIHEEELFVFAPTPELAEKARQEVIAARRRENRYTTSDEPVEASPRREAPPELEAAPASDAPSFTPPRRTELPPLKLAGDDDEMADS